MYCPHNNFPCSTISCVGIGAVLQPMVFDNLRETASLTLLKRRLADTPTAFPASPPADPVSPSRLECSAAGKLNFRLCCAGGGNPSGSWDRGCASPGVSRGGLGIADENRLASQPTRCWNNLNKKYESENSKQMTSHFPDPSLSLLGSRILSDSDPLPHVLTPLC